MNKTGVISARVRPSVKGDADRVLAALGLSVSEAVSIFLTQVVLHRGIPFQIELPASVDLDAFLGLEDASNPEYIRSTKDASNLADASDPENVRNLEDTLDLENTSNTEKRLSR